MEVSVQEDINVNFNALRDDDEWRGDQVDVVKEDLKGDGAWRRELKEEIRKELREGTGRTQRRIGLQNMRSRHLTPG